MAKYDKKFLLKEYQSLIDKIPMGIGIFDGKGNIIISNKTLTDNLGYSKEKFHKLGVSVLYANIKDREKLREKLQKDHMVRDYEILMKDQYGGEFTSLINIDVEEINGEKIYYTTIQNITKQKNAKVKLKESEQRYRTLYKNIPVPTYTWQKKDDDLVLIDYNDAGKAITHDKVQNIIGLKAKDVYAERMHIVEDMLRCLNEKTTFSIEMPYYIEVIDEMKYFNIKYAYVPPDLVMIHTEDITEQKASELNLIESEKKYREAYNKLKESEANYNLLATNINDVIWTLDLNLKTTYVSPSIESILGYTAQEDMERSVNEKFTPESMKKIAKIVRKQLTPKNINDPDFNPVHVLEVEQYHKNGSIVPIEVKVNPMRNEEGIAVGLVGISRNITEKKKNERKLEISEYKYKNLSLELRLILDNLPASICYKDLEGNYIHINKYFADAIGKNKDEIIGKNSFSFFPQEQAQRMLEVDSEVISRKKPIEYIDSYESKTGKRWGLNVKLPLLDEDNNIKGLLAVTNDITDTKKAEEKVRESEKKYREAFTRAEFYKDLFAHDISNLLQGVLSSSQLIEKKIKDPEILAQIKLPMIIIKDQVNRGSSMVQNIHKLSKIEEKITKIEKIEIINILKKIITNFKEQFNNLSINLSLDSNLKEIFIQGNELIQDAFENIIINGIKHNNNINVEIDIRISKEMIDYIPCIKIEFIDNGIGIEDTQKNAFFQSTRSGANKTMGLGLSLVKKIMEMYQGKIWVENKIPNDYFQGSNFILLIPESK